MNTDEYDTGMGTTPRLWQMVSDALDKEKLPGSINSAIGALCDGEAAVEPQNPAAPPPAEPLRWRPGPPICKGWFWVRAPGHPPCVTWIEPGAPPWRSPMEAAGPIPAPMEGGG